MECTKCRKSLPIEEFSLKDKKNGIYYLPCNNCRKKIKEYNDINKDKIKHNYNIVKNERKIECDCGKIYIAFRDLHEIRHLQSKKHIKYLQNLLNT